MVREEIFFGRGLPDRTEISDSAWAQFLADEVTPRFPQGITVLEGRGQWRGQDGVIVRERTWILVLYHEPSEAHTRAVTGLVTAYARRFQQEAVLRDRTGSCVTFQ